MVFHSKRFQGGRTGATTYRDSLASCATGNSFSLLLCFSLSNKTHTECFVILIVGQPQKMAKCLIVVFFFFFQKFHFTFFCTHEPFWATTPRTHTHTTREWTCTTTKRVCGSIRTSRRRSGWNLPRATPRSANPNSRTVRPLQPPLTPRCCTPSPAVSTTTIFSRFFLVFLVF